MSVSTIGSIPESPGTQRTTRSLRWVLATIAGLILATVLLSAAFLPGFPVQPPAPRPPADTRVNPASPGVATMPSQPIDGVLTLTIPPGAAADQRQGGRGYVMPSVISLEVGDTIVIRNDDDAPHMILYAFLMPGESDTRTFTEMGSEVYSPGCGLHAASFLNFTTVFVSEPGTGKATAGVS